MRWLSRQVIVDDDYDDNASNDVEEVDVGWREDTKYLGRFFGLVCLID